MGRTASRSWPIAAPFIRRTSPRERWHPREALQLLPGPVSESPGWSIIGCGDWLQKIIVLLSSFLAGPSTDRAAVEALRQQMSFLMQLSTGLEIQIHGLERHPDLPTTSFRRKRRTMIPAIWHGLIRGERTCPELTQVCGLVQLTVFVTEPVSARFQLLLTGDNSKFGSAVPVINPVGCQNNFVAPRSRCRFFV
jgi:hypothetical protein